MQFLTILKLIISILPLLIEAVKLIESAIPSAGKGDAKLAAVRSIVESSYAAANESLPAFESIWPVLAKTVSGLVNAFNSAGEFKK